MQVTAVDEGSPSVTGKAALQVLTAAALLLPGLACPSAQAADDEVAFQVGRYEESARKLLSVPNNLRPIRVDSLRGDSRLSLGDDLGLAVSYSQDTWSGATPITTAPVSANGNRPIQSGPAGQLVTVGASPMLTGRVLLNSQYQPVVLDPQSGKALTQAGQVVHTLSSASPETRRQIDLKFNRQLVAGGLNVGGGISQERDFQSRFVNAARRWDSEDRLTNVSVGLNYTSSQTAATLDHDAAPYITKTAYQKQIENTGSGQILRGRREDWGASLGLVQVLNAAALFEGSASYTRSAGYLANPYKVMTTIFADPASAQPGTGLLNGDVQALLEQRPGVRNQWSIGGRLVQHLPAFDAALHLGYRHYRDDWGIAAHTFEADWGQPLANGWLLTPRLRYYSQSAANFYSPYLVSQQAYRTVKVDADGQYTITPFDAGKLPAYFSSDQRLSGFGTLSAGLTIAKQLARGVSLEGGVTHTKQAGSLKMGGGGEGSYADFSYTVANIAVRFDLSADFAPVARRATAFADEGFSGEHDHDHGHSHAAHAFTAPAGVMYAHTLDTPGEMMVGYRYQFSREAGDMLHGGASIGATQLLTQGCAGRICYGTPVEMNMHMHMLDLMIGLDNGVSLMVMPQYMTMGMESRLTNSTLTVPTDVHVHTGTQETGGLGDTAVHALFKLTDTPDQQWVLALGGSVPTGNIGNQLRRSHQQDPGYTHYGMQLGSGTWDFLPHLTYLGQGDRWSWGSQLGATVRLQGHNKDGFAFGNGWQGSAWLSHPLNSWLAGSLRGVYREQGAIKGEYRDSHPQSSSPDFAANYGGRYVDIGFGVNAQLPASAARPSALALEWLQPQRTVVNGYQLARRGSLNFSWNQHF